MVNVDWDDMGARIIETLRDLIRFDTTNPPGNETACAEYIRDRLAAEGVPARVLGPASHRGSVVGRLPGDGTRRPLMLLSHLDVVPAEATGWTHPPFSGDRAGGHVWGRGALDMKGMTATELELLLLMKRVGEGCHRDLILAATADEEQGGQQGLGWLVNHHFDLLDAEYALNEGGGAGRKFGDRWLFSVQTAEKGLAWMTLRAHGHAGHASAPMGGRSAVARIAEAVDHLSRTPLPRHRVATVETNLRALAEVLPPAKGQALLRVLQSPDGDTEALSVLEDESIEATIRASLRNTATPTGLRAGSQPNVIPSVADAVVDGRPLPGQSTEDLLAEMRAVVGPDIEIEVFNTSPWAESAYEAPLFHTIQSVLADLVPGSLATPSMSTGGTDAPFLTARGVQVYGFWPLCEYPDQPPMLRLAHGVDERVSEDNLCDAAKILWEVIWRTCTQE